MESFEELARKVEILERELTVQRQAIEKLKEMGTATKEVGRDASPPQRQPA
jgi:hypothetical protein